MRFISIVEFKATVDALAEQYPDAKVDFVYPKRHGNKMRSALGQMTTYSVLLSSFGGGTLRIFIDWARDNEQLKAPPT